MPPFPATHRPRTIGRVPSDHFGSDVARRYDESAADMFKPDVLGPTVDRLEELAGDGRALELAIGTGRVALPLASRGVSVSGIELSTAMVDELRAKPGGGEISVTIGDMATTRVAGRFRLVYLVFNTIVNLTSQDAQVDCFANAAAHLEPGGSFVVEVGVPQLQRLPPGDHHQVFAASGDHWGIDEFDVVTQQLKSHHFSASDTGFRLSSIPFRYVWHSELDLMARLAGLRLLHRWDDWRRAPFTADSRSHISVWTKPQGTV